MRRNTLLETLTAISFLVFVGIVLYYSFYPFKVTTLNSIGIDNAEYCRGDWVQVEMSFIKHMDVQAKVTWYIVDGIIYELASPGINRPEGDNHIIVSKQIPHSILPGKYNLRVVQEYDIHPFHKPIINTWNTPIFEVLGEDKCPGDKEETSNFPNPVSRPVVTQATPTPDMQSTAQSPGAYVQPVDQTTTIITEQSEPRPQVATPAPEKNPIKDLLETVTAPVRDLLK